MRSQWKKEISIKVKEYTYLDYSYLGEANYLDVLKYYKRKKIWITKTGEVIKIKDLKDSHLHNIIIFLEKVATRLSNSIPYPQFNGEMAQMYAEQDYNLIQEDPVDFFLCDTIYETLLEEREKRELRRCSAKRG